MKISKQQSYLGFSLVLALLASACATVSVPEGMKAGEFVRLICVGQSFQVRAADDGRTVRVRTMHGSAELDKKADGMFEGDGFALSAVGEKRISLSHNGKLLGSSCKPA